MVTAWDKFQELVRDEMRKAYSETVIDQAMNSRTLEEGLQEALIDG